MKYIIRKIFPRNWAPVSQFARRKTSTVCAYTLFPHPERRNSKMPWIKWKFGAFKWRTQIQERLWSDHRSKLFRNFTNKLHDWYQPSIREFSQCLRTIYDCSASIYTTLYVFVSKISVCRSKHSLKVIRFSSIISLKFSKPLSIPYCAIVARNHQQHWLTSKSISTELL